MADKQNWWVYNPPKQKRSQPKVPDTLKAEVTTKANQFIDSVLKPTYVHPPPENPQYNYMVDIASKWYHSSFYFYSTYCVPGPNALFPSFEHRFARMQYAGNNRFHLSIMRYNGEWVGLYIDQTLDECLAAIRDEPYFAIG